MRNLLSIGTLFFLACVARCVEPAAAAPADGSHSHQASQSATDAGAVLLKNGHVLRGVATQLGNRIEIEIASGSKVRVPVDNVLCWGPNLRSLYRYRVDHRGHAGLREHLSDAKWCISNELYDEASYELMHAQRLAPGHQEIVRLQGRLRERTKPTEAVTPPVKPVVHKEEVETRFVPLATTQQFTRSVQSILINRCGACHDTTRSNQFKLARLAGTSRVSAEMTHANLQRTIRWLNTEQPLQSDLLTYAQNAHGGSKQPPLGKQQAKALKTLVDWALQVTSAQQAPRVAALPTSREMSPFDDQAVVDPIRKAAAAPEVKLAPDSIRPQAIDPLAPVRLPSVADPFDPEVFNRRFHSK